MAIRRKSVKTWVKNLKKSDDYYVYQLGPKPEIAAKMIQRFVKKLLFKFKIRRISRVYYALRAQIIEEMDNKIRRYLRIFQSKTIIAGIKFKIYKAKRLQQIREKVSIISVKNYWRKSKFTFKVIMQKIKRFKRMKKNEERIKKASNANLLQVKQTAKRGNFLSVHDSNIHGSSRNSLSYDDFDSGTENEEGKEGENEVDSMTSEINRKLEEERQGILTNMRLAYNLPKAKDPLNVLPYLYQKDIIEGVSPPSHYISTTRASVFRMNDVTPMRINPRLKTAEVSVRNPLSLIKPYPTGVRKPRPGGDQNPLYMKPTTASKMCRWDAEAPNEEVEEPKKYIKPREDSKVLSPTYTYLQKKTKGYLPTEKFDKPIWRPSTQHTEPPKSSGAITKKAKTPKGTVRPSTMSMSPRMRIEKRVQTAISPIPEARIEVNSLSFEAALPGLANMLSSYSNGFVVRLRPRVDKGKGNNK